MAWGKAGSTTLTSAGDSVDIGTITASKTMNTMFHVINNGSTTDGTLRFNNNSSANYPSRWSNNGGSENTATNHTYTLAGYWGSEDTLGINYICNVSGEEKLSIMYAVARGTAGAGNAPNRREAVGKFTETTGQITDVEGFNEQAGSFDTNTNLTVLGSEITPAAAIPAIDDVQDNSLFVDKVNARRYWFTPNTVTLQSDFSSSTGWTTSSSSLLNVDTSAQEIDFTFNVDNGDLATMYYDLTSTSDTKWLLRSQIDIDTIAQGSDTNDKWLFYGLSSTNNGANETQDFLGMAIRVDNTKTELLAIETDGSAPNNESTTVFTRNAQAETLYVEMKRESATSFTVSLYSDSAYSTLLESKTITVSSGTATLRYLKLSGLQGFSDSQIVGSIPNMTLYNSATTPATWTMPPTHEIDLSTSAGWTTTGSNCSVNTTGQYLEGSSSTNDDRATKALGLTLSDTKFVVRQKMELTTVTSGGNGQVYFGYTDKDNSTTVLGNRDGIGITIRSSPDFLQSYALNQYWQSSATLTTTPTATTYYLELIRNSATSYTLNLYSDSNYSVLVETKTNSIPSSVNGLNHITIGGWDNNASGVITARFSDIQIYNGVTTPN
jgi:hypothetical protein